MKWTGKNWNTVGVLAEGGNPVEKRNTGDGPILSPRAAAGDVRAYVRTQS